MHDADHNDDGYDGPVTVHVGDVEVSVDGTLTGHFEPVDGRYHWYGRLAANEELTAAIGGGNAEGEVSTPHGTVAAQLSDIDPWGRYRVSGTSTPPFPVVTELEVTETAQESSG